MLSIYQYLAIIGLSLIGASVAIIYHQAIPAFLLGWVFGETLHLLSERLLKKNE